MCHFAHVWLSLECLEIDLVSQGFVHFRFWFIFAKFVLTKIVPVWVLNHHVWQSLFSHTSAKDVSFSFSAIAPLVVKRCMSLKFKYSFLYRNVIEHDVIRPGLFPWLGIFSLWSLSSFTYWGIQVLFLSHSSFYNI